MSLLMEQLSETVSFIRSQYANTPLVGIVLGSGLGNLVAEMTVEKEIPYHQLPHFPVSTVEGHSGKLIFGELLGKKVLVMAGRFHYYEGYSASEVSYPIRVMKLLGVETLLLSNAAGGMNTRFAVGDLMIINDHISLFAVNPLIGKNEKELGPRFPDMSEPYNRSLIARARTIASSLNIPVHEGVYVGVTGPTFETRAEYKMLHTLGADAVGMSTVQEVIVARHMDIQVFAISVITDLGIREEENIITHEEVLQAASEAEPKLTAIFKQLVQVI
ncbi:purine-nucleoside phosphorylase [Flavihumibacter fluvii]|uniref:purine-nucleoside phosphorylase n=1 Tax=Flavihumibacter fluvii TaxID=2838157 RepID=UPI001BDF58A7|nr:purine-nucleoside phosphorylase [Flavihumibacter fluvii]ULQ53539.1 purine-nucleoside phosphorylase [Flavihumibacter fluvii]